VAPHGNRARSAGGPHGGLPAAGDAMVVSSSLGRIAVVAIGGNSLSREGQVGNIPEQYDNSRETCRHIAALVDRGYDLVVTHGNGPQVGNVLLRVEMAARSVYTLPLDICDSDTQGGIGYMLQQVLGNELRGRGVTRPVVTLVTQVVVDPADPAFQHPSKPIGPFYSAVDAEARMSAFGWSMVEDAGRGWRRVVPSPHPREIVELEAIRKAVADGVICIAVGGGGIPVVRGAKGALEGCEAVIDKDRSSALLARLLGAELFLISTGVPQVMLDYRKPTQRALDRLTAAEAREHLAAGQFPPGSMGPKIEAALDFLAGGTGEVVITSPEHIPLALDGTSGTRIVP
jgi:carbamate kinase